MKIRTAILSLAVVALACGNAWADDDKKKEGKGKRGEMRKKLIEKFDADGDGKLSDDEKAKAREAMKKRRGQGRSGGDKARGGRGKGRPGGGASADFRKKMLEKYDADGDGKLNEEERGKARKEMQKHFKERREAMLKKFDKDGDGKLNEDERKALHAEMKKRRGDRKRPGGPGKRPSPEMRKKLLEKFDADGDGKLNEDERAKARESFKKRGKPGGKKD